MVAGLVLSQLVIFRNSLKPKSFKLTVGPQQQTCRRFVQQESCRDDNMVNMKYKLSSWGSTNCHHPELGKLHQYFVMVKNKLLSWGSYKLLSWWTTNCCHEEVTNCYQGELQTVAMRKLQIVVMRKLQTVVMVKYKLLSWWSTNCCHEKVQICLILALKNHTIVDG